MSCGSIAAKIANLGSQISAGIAQLSSKQAFYAGVVIGAGGTGLGVFSVAKRRNIANIFKRGRGPTPVALVGGAPSRAGSSQPKKRPVKPTAGRSKPKPVPAKPIPAKPAQPQTKLQAASIQVRNAAGNVFPAPSSYVLLRPDGTETGLAITPRMKQTEAGQLVEDTTAWSVTHAGSGALIGGPYDSVARSQALATQLSPLRWTESTVPREDVLKAQQIIQDFK